MTPDDLVAVRRSWRELASRRADLVERLEPLLSGGRPADASHPRPARERALWLVDAVAELVDLLAAPSELGRRARVLAETWPDRPDYPTFEVEGRAWMTALRVVGRTWTPGTAQAWRRAWHLLSEELALEALSPFTEPPATGRHGAGSPVDSPVGSYGSVSVFNQRPEVV